jgi:hypothetical protein
VAEFVMGKAKVVDKAVSVRRVDGPGLILLLAISYGIELASNANQGACAFAHRPQFVSGYSTCLTGEKMSALETQGLGMIPMVIEQSGRGERSYDIYSRLLKERVIFWWACQRPDCQSGGGAVAVP